MLKKLARMICRPEIKRLEREVEELRGEVWKRKARPTRPVLIKESKNQCAVIKCVCGNEMLGTFEREKGFDFKCANCDGNINGIITGFTDDIKEKFKIADLEAQRKRALENAKLVKIHELRDFLLKTVEDMYET